MEQPDRTDLYVWGRYIKGLDDASAMAALAVFRDEWLRSHGERLIEMMQSHFTDVVHFTQAASLLLSFQRNPKP